MNYKKTKRFTMLPLRKRIAIAINLFIFIAAVYFLETVIVTRNAVTNQLSFVPMEIRLPHLTLTNEMKVGMFFEDLRTDPTVIRPKDIAKSITPWEIYIESGGNTNYLSNIIINFLKGVNRQL